MSSFSKIDYSSPRLHKTLDPPAYVMILKDVVVLPDTGNTVNVGTSRGDAHACNLDTLLKLVDTRRADGKTTGRYFVAEEIIRSEGTNLSSGTLNENSGINDDDKLRRRSLKVLAGLDFETSNVWKAATTDRRVMKQLTSLIIRTKVDEGIAKQNTKFIDLIFETTQGMLGSMIIVVLGVSLLSLRRCEEIYKELEKIWFVGDNALEYEDPTIIDFASVAQIHGAKAKVTQEEAVTKILKPGIENSLVSLNFLDVIARILESLSPDLGRASLIVAIKDKNESMLEAVDYMNEAKNVKLFRKYWEAMGFPRQATIPQIYNGIGKETGKQIHELFNPIFGTFIGGLLVVVVDAFNGRNFLGILGDKYHLEWGEMS